MIAEITRAGTFGYIVLSYLKKALESELNPLAYGELVWAGCIAFFTTYSPIARPICVPTSSSDESRQELLCW
jgi:hypothetical protein